MKIIRNKNLKYIPASHEDQNKPGVLKKILLTKNDLINGRIQMINWAKLPRGKSFRKHFHTDMEEVFILTKGKVKMIVEDVEAEIFIGDAVLVNVNQPHTMINQSEIDVEYIVIGVTTDNNGKTVICED